MTTLLAGGQVRRTLRHLADGREIVYYDDSPGYVTGALRRADTDIRTLPPAEGGSTLRFDVLTGEWVVTTRARGPERLIGGEELWPERPAIGRCSVLRQAARHRATTGGSLLRVPGKLKYLAGSESGAGTWINDVQPERIAARLREVAS